MAQAKRKKLWETVTEQPATAAPKIREARTDRAGKRMIGFYIPDAAYRQLRQLGLDEETTNQELLTEALNMLFQKRGKPPIA
jgi:Antitoxin-like ribbon-helix-helix